ncbi:MAG TPA: lysine--tRNA ligase [Bacillota bacterium]|nr:lysine--tRNA ligase [Bacillota bacterium]
MTDRPGHPPSPNSTAPASESAVDFLQARRDKLDKLVARGMEPWGRAYRRTHSLGQVTRDYAQLAGCRVAVAGRITGRRSHGKTAFCDLEDASGQLQIYLRLDRLGAEKYADLELLDLGDHLGVSGEVFRTRSGEITIEAEDWVFLGKSLRPPPEKYHGLANVESRYRQRYLDLMANKQVRDVLRVRSLVIRALRDILDARGYLEMETPTMSTIVGGANARPFITRHNALDISLYLRVATELYLKRLVVGGFDRVYEIGRVFRNEGVSSRHNPEYTLLEFYEAYSDYEDLMIFTEQLIPEVARRAIGTTTLTYQGNVIDLSPPWPRIRLREAISRYTGVDFLGMAGGEQIRSSALALGLELPAGASRGQMLDALLDHFVQPRLIQPTFLIDYPVELSPLAKRHRDDPALTARFEAFIGGIEVANAFSELNDPDDQRERFLAQAVQRDRGDEEAHMMDDDYIVALEHGLPPTAGEGIGVDRLVMILTDSPSIREVIPFPLLRPRG